MFSLPLRLAVALGAMEALAAACADVKRGRGPLTPQP